MDIRRLLNLPCTIHTVTESTADAYGDPTLTTSNTSALCWIDRRGNLGDGSEESGPTNWQTDTLDLYLDAGTTTACLIPSIAALADMTVLTNDFHTALALSDHPGVTVVHTGGVLDHRNGSGIGLLAAATLRRLVADIAFLSASSWDLERGVTTPSAPKVEVKRAAMEIASQRVLLATGAKYGTYGTYRIAALGEFDLVVTDDGLSEAAVLRMRESGVEVAIAPTATPPPGVPG